jgi:hypothetical protein
LLVDECFVVKSVVRIWGRPCSKCSSFLCGFLFCKAIIIAIYLPIKQATKFC